MCIKSDAKNGQQYQKWLFAVIMNRDGADAESPFPLFFSFSASFKNSSPREKVGKLSSFWDWWAESLFVSIIVAKYIIFPALTMAARAKKKFLAKRFAHAISVRYLDFEHAYVCWIWLRGSASYVINRFDPWLRFCNICTREAWGLPIPRNSRGFWKQERWRRKSLSCRGLQRFVMTT